jgi:hypothetical protein
LGDIIILFWKLRGFTVSCLGLHKWEPDIYTGFSPALHLQCCCPPSSARPHINRPFMYHLCFLLYGLIILFLLGRFFSSCPLWSELFCPTSPLYPSLFSCLWLDSLFSFRSPFFPLWRCQISVPEGTAPPNPPPLPIFASYSLA